jgi:uncharacterized protein YfeS
MREDILWDCAYELAPFGSDEGSDAYAEYRSWRAENPTANLIDCIAWILGGRLAEYNFGLTTDAAIEQCDESAESLGYSDAFTLDATIIATVLGQLVNEGRIDAEVKPFANVAVARQIHPGVLAQYPEDVAAERRAILQLVQNVIDAA